MAHPQHDHQSGRDIEPGRGNVEARVSRDEENEGTMNLPWHTEAPEAFLPQ